MAIFQAVILSKAEYGGDEPIQVMFRLTNVSQEAMHILTWFTPLEGLWSDCLRVSQDGRQVAYDGRLAKRGTPTKEDYITIPPGESVSREVQLDEAYEILATGVYSVIADTEVHAIPARELESLPNSQLSVVEALGALEKRSVRQPLSDAVTNFQVRGPRTGRVTLGERVRQLQPKQESASPKFKAGAAAVAKDPQFAGGTQTERDQTKQAHFDGYQLANDAFNALTNDSNYVEWFGTYTSARLQAVKDHYAVIVGDMASKIFTYDLTKTGCKPGVYAYTYKGSSTIWMCDAFWSAPSTGTDSKAGTVVHEHSHASASTDDLAYGQANCRQLAIGDPDKAIRNADSHEYYAKG